MRIEEHLNVSNANGDKTYTPAQVIAILDGAGGGGGSTPRLSQTVSYWTGSISPTVYYTALRTDGTTLSARSTSGVVLANGLYQKTQDTTGLTDFIAVWDEGDVNDKVSEWIVVDQ